MTNRRNGTAVGQTFRDPENYCASNRMRALCAEIVPFPVAARQRFIGNAFIEAELHTNGAAYLHAIMDRYRARLDSIGATPDRIDAEIRYLDAIFFGDKP